MALKLLRLWRDRHRKLQLTSLTTVNIDQTVSVAPDTEYTLTGWLRTSSNNNAGYFGVRDSSGNVISEAEYNSLPGYTQLTVTLNTGSNGTVVVYGGLWASGDTWMQLEDVSLMPT